MKNLIPDENRKHAIAAAIKEAKDIARHHIDTHGQLRPFAIVLSTKPPEELQIPGGIKFPPNPEGRATAERIYGKGFFPMLIPVPPFLPFNSPMGKAWFSEQVGIAAGIAEAAAIVFCSQALALDLPMEPGQAPPTIEELQKKYPHGIESIPGAEHYVIVTCETLDGHTASRARIQQQPIEAPVDAPPMRLGEWEDDGTTKDVAGYFTGLMRPVASA